MSIIQEIQLCFSGNSQHKLSQQTLFADGPETDLHAFT